MSPYLTDYKKLIASGIPKLEAIKIILDAAGPRWIEAINELLPEINKG